MRTVNDDYIKQMARLRYRASWDFRIVDQDGKVFTIPPKAITNRHRNATLDDWTWKLTLDINPDRLPKTTVIQQYHRLEVDRIVAGQVFPYFRGIIDKVAPSTDVEKGRELKIDAFGVFQKAKKFWINRISVDPEHNASTTRKLTGLCTKEQVRVDSSSAPTSERLPIPCTYKAADASSPLLRIAADSAFSSPYVKGTNYTVSTDAQGFTLVTWLTTPATTRYFEIAKVGRFGALTLTSKTGATIPAFFVCPYGRQVDDLFHTFVDAFDLSAKTITPRDSTGYRNLLDLTQGEYLTVTTLDGTETQLKIASVSIAGVLTIDPADTIPAGISAGDPLRLSTTECFQAWNEIKQIELCSDSGLTTKYNKKHFKILPDLGQAIPTRVHDWTTSEEVYSLPYELKRSDANRVESVLKLILTDRTGLFATDEITTEKTGAFTKNYYRKSMWLSDVLAEWKDKAFPPNAYLHDTPEGKVAIQSYTQRPIHDWQMRGVKSIEIIDEPEPVTAVTVISTTTAQSNDDDRYNPSNKAPEWFFSSSNVTNPQKAIDNVSNVATEVATPITASNPAYITFRIPASDPATLYNQIERIEVTGTGLLSVAKIDPTGAVSPRIIPRFNYLPLGQTETISSDELVYATDNSTDTFIRFQFDRIDNDGSFTNAEIKEIRFVCARQAAWTASLIDVTDSSQDAYSVANNGESNFGSIWMQKQQKTAPYKAYRESYRYAPSGYLKRVKPIYSKMPRHLILEMPGISPQDCRDYAERYADENLRTATRYRIVAPIDDRGEFGDTVLVRHPDTGELLRLFFWGIEDGGAVDDIMATFEMVDYGV